MTRANLEAICESFLGPGFLLVEEDVLARVTVYPVEVLDEEKRQAVQEQIKRQAPLGIEVIVTSGGRWL